MRDLGVGFQYLVQGQRWVARHGKQYGFGLIPATYNEYYDLPADILAVPDWATLVTYAFLHADFWHLLGNMVFLWVFADNIEDESHIIYAEPDETTDDDPDVYPLDPDARELDLRPAIREQWLLAQPRYVLCREDCKGLCPRCGTDLNDGPCDCPPQTDSRWDSLRKAERA